MKILRFFTAFVWGSTYTTHKNAKIYRYSWLFAYYRRELWERSCISILKKNRSFQITLLMLTTVSLNQNRGQCSCLPSEHCSCSGFSQKIRFTPTSRVCWMDPTHCSLSKLHKPGAGGAQCLPSSDLEHLYSTETFHSRDIRRLGSIHRKGKIIFLLNKLRNVNSVTSFKKKTKQTNSLRTCNW